MLKLIELVIEDLINNLVELKTRGAKEIRTRRKGEERNVEKDFREFSKFQEKNAPVVLEGQRRS
jgi:hypothetical protein